VPHACCASKRENRVKSLFLHCDSRALVQGNPPPIVEKLEKQGFLAHFWRSAVTLHQELDGISRLLAASKVHQRPISPPVVELNHDNL
jgi:hypothetical protein